MIRSSLKSKPSGMQGSILARLGGSRETKTDPVAPHPASRCAKRWRWGLLLVAVAGFVVWLVHARWHEAEFEWEAFGASFLHLDWKWIVAAGALSILTYYGRALRWGVMLKPLTPEPNHWRLFKATAIGFTAVVLLGRPGEFVRPYLISLRERVPLSSQLAAWLLERICDLLAVLLIFGFALTQLDPGRAHVGQKLRWVLEVGGYILGAIGLACLVILVMLSQFSDAMRRRLMAGLSFLPEAYLRKIERVVRAFLEGASATKTQRSVIWLGFYTLLEWALIVLCFVCLFKAYPVTSGFALRDILIFMGFVAFGSILQIPGVGGGVQIVSIVVLTEMYGLGMELATSIAVMIWIITFVGIVPLGLLFGFHEGLNWKRLREMEQDAVAHAECNGAANGA
jgi:uncharacterized protein (TIRG00374 family)